MTDSGTRDLEAQILARSSERKLREWGEQFAAFGHALVAHPEQIMIPGAKAAPGTESRLMFYWKDLSPIAAWPVGKRLVEYAHLAQTLIAMDINAARRDASGRTGAERGEIVKRFGVLKLSLAEDGRKLVDFGGTLARTPQRCALLGQRVKAADAAVYDMTDILPLAELAPLLERIATPAH